jgi:hypothetical protein
MQLIQPIRIATLNHSIFIVKRFSRADSLTNPTYIRMINLIR